MNAGKKTNIFQPATEEPFTHGSSQHVGDGVGGMRSSLMVSCSAEWQLSSAGDVTESDGGGNTLELIYSAFKGNCISRLPVAHSIVHIVQSTNYRDVSLADQCGK